MRDGTPQVCRRDQNEGRGLIRVQSEQGWGSGEGLFPPPHFTSPGPTGPCEQERGWTISLLRIIISPVHFVTFFFIALVCAFFNVSR